jgi:hypothetical protein
MGKDIIQSYTIVVGKFRIAAVFLFHGSGNYHHWR